MKRWILMAALVAVGCNFEDKEQANLGGSSPTKAEARAQGGVDDDGEDICETLDWYGDGVCDDFCVETDSDCDPPNNASTNNTGTNNAGTNNAGTNNASNNASTNNTQNNVSGADCGGIAGLVCADTEFCNYPADTICGAADQLGTCEPRPEVCTDIYQPVCGCDGGDYSNECDANAAGTDVATEGTCAGNTACAADSDCQAGETCVNGLCTVPTACSDDADCERGELCVAGVCTPDPAGISCGTRGAPPCPADYFCDWEPRDLCGAADAPGSCQAIPQLCPDVFQPVCGCDGATYGNSCEANAAGVSVASDGECVKTCQANTDCAAGELCINGTCQDLNPGQCGGIIGSVCAADEWCDYPDNTICGAADQLGDCLPRPQACILIFDPVCGCDNVTYSNACFANAAGVDVASPGNCP